MIAWIPLWKYKTAAPAQHSSFGNSAVLKSVQHPPLSLERFGFSEIVGIYTKDITEKKGCLS